MLISDNTESFELKLIRVVRSMEILLDERKTPKVLQDIEEFLRNGHYSIGMQSAIYKVLKSRNLEELIIQAKKDQIEEHNKIFSREKLLEEDSLSLEADKAILEAIISAFPDIKSHLYPIPNNVTTYKNIGALLYALNIGGTVVSGYYVLGFRKRVNELIEVIRGASAAVKVELQYLVSEAQHALNTLNTMKDPPSMFLVRTAMEDQPIVDWKLASAQNLNNSIIIQALDYPSDMVALTAANIVEGWTMDKEIKDEFINILNTGNWRALYYISQLASKIWNQDAPKWILKRLEGTLTRGCEYLFTCLPVLLSNKIDTQTSQCYIRGITTSNIEVAVGAAKGLDIFDNLTKEMSMQIENALEYWKDHEPKYVDEKGFVQPSPRPNLLSVLTKVKELSFEELLLYYHHKRNDVSNVAKEAIIKVANSNNSILLKVVQLISEEKISRWMLNDLVNKVPSEKILLVKDKILDLLNSKNPKLRIAALQTLNLGWLSKEKSEEVCNMMLKDSVPEVRTRAVRTLRFIKST